MSRKYQEKMTKLETQWRKKLSSILEELTDYQYKRMLMYLNKIPEQTKSKTPRGEMAQIVIKHYGLEKSIEEINKNVLHICKRDRKIRDMLQPILKKLEAVKALNKKTENERRSGGAAGGEDMQRPDRPSKWKKQPSPQPEAAGSEMPRKKKCD